LAGLHVPHVAGIHAENGSNAAEGKKDDSHDGEGVDGGLLAVFVERDLLRALGHSSINDRWPRGVMSGGKFTNPSLKIRSSIFHFLKVPDPLVYQGNTVVDK
jgi:hypothetical protein